MKVAILGESEADEAILRVFVEKLLSTPIDPVRPPPRRRAPGWDGLLKAVPLVVRSLHYQTDADGLVLVGDANHSPFHQSEPPPPSSCSGTCRLCRLREIVENERKGLRLGARSEPLKIAIGLAVPAMEAWLRCGQDADISEATWAEGLQTHRYPCDKRVLKQRVYGTD